MKPFLLGLLLIGICTPAWAQDKHAYDLHHADTRVRGAAHKLSQGPGYVMATNDRTALSLLNDGYFTIGTTQGLTPSRLDDNAQITFGHPFALTSYPSFSLDGVWHHPETFFFDAEQHLHILGDTLRLSITDETPLQFQFDMIPQDDGARIRLALTLTNTDAAPHEVGMGLLFDPALGQWGDGVAEVEGQRIDRRTEVQTDIPEQITLWERAASRKGLGIRLDVAGASPRAVTFGNWFDLHAGHDAVVDALYDLAVRLTWDAVTLNPGERRSFAMDVALVEPDFPDGLFLRTDLPAFFSLENNLLFPRSYHAVVVVYNNSATTKEFVSLDLDGSEFAEPAVPDIAFSVPPDSAFYAGVGVSVSELFEDLVVPLTLSVFANGEEVDRLERNVFVPAVPFSDTGLAVEIDSVITSEPPEVGVIFHADVEETGQPLFQLRPENIFLFEDGQRIRDFSVGKDTTGGVDQADIVFVFDVTGSMSNEIDAVKDNIIEFSDSLSARGIDYRLGMVTFLDIIENVYDFRTDVQEFQGLVALQRAHGGGDQPENSLEALLTAAEFHFRPAANRIVIWITDADYHISDGVTPLTVQQVINALLAQGIVVHGIGDVQFQATFFNPILNATGGDFFDINGNFRDILLDISRLNGTRSFLLNYTSQAASGRPQTVTLELHFAGLGGSATVEVTTGKGLVGMTESEAPLPGVKSYPNPFNGSTRIRILNPERHGGHVDIINMLGQRVRRLPFAEGQDTVQLVWDATDQSGAPLAGGVYVAQVRLYSPGTAVAVPAFTMVHVK